MKYIEPLASRRGHESLPTDTGRDSLAYLLRTRMREHLSFDFAKSAAQPRARAADHRLSLMPLPVRGGIRRLGESFGPSATKKASTSGHSWPHQRNVCVSRVANIVVISCPSRRFPSERLVAQPSEFQVVLPEPGNQRLEHRTTSCNRHNVPMRMRAMNVQASSLSHHSMLEEHSVAAEDLPKNAMRSLNDGAQLASRLQRGLPKVQQVLAAKEDHVTSRQRTERYRHADALSLVNEAALFHGAQRAVRANREPVVVASHGQGDSTESPPVAGGCRTRGIEAVDSSLRTGQ